MICGVGSCGPRFSAGPNCWADATAASRSAPPKIRFKLLHESVAACSPEPQFYNTTHNVGPRKEQVAWTRNRELDALQVADAVTDRVPPRVGLRVQIIVHIEHWKFD